MEEKLTSSNIELVIITPITDGTGFQSGRFHRLDKAELDALVADL